VAARRCLNVTFAELLCRIRAEYLEMPGLRLTAPQAQCLFGLGSWRLLYVPFGSSRISTVARYLTGTPSFVAGRNFHVRAIVTSAAS